MKTKPLVLFLLALPLLIAAGFYFARSGADFPLGPRHRATPTAREQTANAPALQRPGATVQVSPEATSPSMPSPSARLLKMIEAALATLQGGPNAAALEELRRALLGAEPGQSIAAILDFLTAGGDAATGEEFTIGEGGKLTGAPTMRVLLLDLLGQLSKTARNDSAAKFSRSLLAAKTSADEWAMALRNVAWSEPAAKPYLAGKMREMLTHEPWRARPTAGMLEAFDVVVFTKDPTLVPDLAEVQQNGPRELQYAAAIALDRLAEQGPLEVMTYLNTHPTELADRPLLRADYYAKADLSQIAQRAALEVYLGRPDVTAAEKDKLLKGLATPATFVSENLLTEPPVADDGAARQDALAKATADWLAANRFPDLRLPLEQLQRRLGP